MPDKTLTCQDCKNPFLFTESEQEHFAKQIDRRTGKAWTDPKRCRACRDINRQSRPKQDQQTG